MALFKEAFTEAEASLADALKDRTQNTCQRLLDTFGPTLRCRDPYHRDYRSLLTHRRFFKDLNARHGSSIPGQQDMAIQYDKISVWAAQSASDLIDGFVAKLNQKLGDLDSAEVRYANGGGSFYITGTKNGHTVTVDQQVVIKCNSHGTWFAQFPARIYVDGKFTPASKYNGAVA